MQVRLFCETHHMINTECGKMAYYAAFLKYLEPKLINHVKTSMLWLLQNFLMHESNILN